MQSNSLYSSSSALIYFADQFVLSIMGIFDLYFQFKTYFLELNKLSREVGVLRGVQFTLFEIK